MPAEGVSTVAAPLASRIVALVCSCGAAGMFAAAFAADGREVYACTGD